MLTPSSVRLIEPPIATYKVNGLNELEIWIQTCTQSQFTGRLDLHIKDLEYQHWSLFFRSGYFIGGASELHPVRRWYRQWSLHCPHLVSHFVHHGEVRFQDLDHRFLADLMNQKRLSRQEMTALVKGNLVEILFDLLQLRHQQGDRLKVRLTYRKIPPDLTNAASVLIQPPQALQEANQAWQVWQQAELTNWSPNLAPVIWDAGALRQQTSLLAYHNLMTLVTGNLTLRDLAVKLKQQLVPLTHSLIPHVQKGVMGLSEIKDLSEQTGLLSTAVQKGPTLNRSGVVQAQTSGPLIAYIEDSRFDSLAMNQILTQAGYRFMNIQDPVQALPILLEQKPSLIFLDLLMPVANGYEVCGQIRRVSLLKKTPVIIVTSSDGIVDRVRAKLVGSSGFIAKPIETDKVLAVLHSHLPIAPSRGLPS